jgi:hypothetical protein
MLFMGKYEPLRRYLESQSVDSVNANFAQLEAILGFPLPHSAYKHQAWWANEAHGSHSHSRSWQDAGWETSMVNTSRRTVRFQKRGPDRTPNIAVASRSSDTADLWEQAAKLTGIEGRDKLIEAALTALIRQETTRYFARIGGSMPDASAAPRERPFE